VEVRISFSIYLVSSVVKGVDMVAGWGGWWCKVGRVGGMITGARNLALNTKVLLIGIFIQISQRELQRSVVEGDKLTQP
jgi:hypothetical protein